MFDIDVKKNVLIILFTFQMVPCVTTHLAEVP